MRSFLYFRPIFIKIGPFRQILITENVKFPENATGGSGSDRDKNDETNDRILRLLCDGCQQLVANVLNINQNFSVFVSGQGSYFESRAGLPKDKKINW